jgi:putative aldouronate transport system substrate-binding protein
MDRRSFVRVSTGSLLIGTLGVQALLEACTPVPGPSAKPASSAAGSGTAALPTYVAFKGPDPDLAGTIDGVQPAYYSYPKNPVRRYPQPPLKGIEVTGIVSTPTPPPIPMDQNPTWQEVNRQLGATFKLSIVPSPDYPPKLATVMASDDTPDLVYINQGGPLPAANLLSWLQAKCLDLTPFLSGDAVKEFPNLANMPTYNWKGTGTFYSGKIWGVPCPRPVISSALMVHQEMLDEIGAQMPTSADDFKRILVALTRPNQNIWGFGAQGPTAFNMTGIFPQIFGAPNNWKADANGKLVKNWETDEFKASVGFVRDLFQAGVFHPNSTTYTAPGADSDFSAGRFAFYYSTWTGFSTVFWPQSIRLNPAVKLRPAPPFSADGKSKPRFLLGIGNFGNTYLKKTSADRAKDLLRVLDFLASPFGTQEQMLLSYGVQGADYTIGSNGNPITTPEGFATKPVPWRFMTQYPVVQYNTVNSLEFARVVHTGEEAMIPVGVQDPTLPLYSATYANNNAILQGDFLSGITDIVTGRRPIGDLDGLVSDWRTKGGDKMRAEFEQSLAAA